jgi:hypothetical protein
VTVDARCAKPVDRFDWVLDTGNLFQRIDIIDGKEKVDHKWNNSVCDADEYLTFRLTIYRGTESATAEKTIRVRSNLKDDQAAMLELSLETHLEVSSPDDRSRGRILVDGRFIAAVIGGQPSSVRTVMSPGVHELEAVVMRSPGAPGVWSFQLRDTQATRGVGIQVVQGTVLANGPGTITFRLGGEPEERIRFRFELGR